MLLDPNNLFMEPGEEMQERGQTGIDRTHTQKNAITGLETPYSPNLSDQKRKDDILCDLETKIETFNDDDSYKVTTVEHAHTCRSDNETAHQEPLALSSSSLGDSCIGNKQIRYAEKSTTLSINSTCNESKNQNTCVQKAHAKCYLPPSVASKQNLCEAINPSIKETAEYSKASAYHLARQFLLDVRKTVLSPIKEPYQIAQIISCVK